jgi:hypothetical protein
MPSVRQVELVNGGIEASYDGDEDTAAEILHALTSAGIKVSEFSTLDGGLEDAFLRATSEETA